MKFFKFHLNFPFFSKVDSLNFSTDQLSTRRKIRDQSSIFSAEHEAYIGAIQKLPTTGVRGVIFTDSLSTMMV
jgi:hypothetical protein